MRCKMRNKAETRGHKSVCPTLYVLMKNTKIKRMVLRRPMMDWTDRHCRAFHRTLTRRALLSEMLTADAVIHGDRARLLAYSEAEHPVALQLGGSEPGKMRKAAMIGAALGYDEINLNIGCPSDRVQAGRFGACLMREPDLVAQLWSAAQAGAQSTPVTIKCRIGVDDQEPREALFDWSSLLRARLHGFIVHARRQQGSRRRKPRCAAARLRSRAN